MLAMPGSFVPNEPVTRLPSFLSANSRLVVPVLWKPIQKTLGLFMFEIQITLHYTLV